MENGNKFTARQIFTMFVIGSVHFAGAICVSLQAPFYPQEAEFKGASATEYGLVFGIFELMSFLSCPLLGKYMYAIGPKFVLNSGIFVAAGSSVLFGILDFVKGHAAFISLSFAIRIVEALGASAATTAAFSITAALFPDRMATTFATLEIFYGVGYIVGPVIGGILYSIGGYVLPFVVTGSVLALDGLLIFVSLPNLKDDDDQSIKSQQEVFSILKVPSVALVSLCTTIAAMSAGFLSATLEPHLRQFGFSPMTTGFIFVINGAMYAVSAPLVGRLCDRNFQPKKIIIVGGLFIMTCYFLLGPFPYIPLDTTPWLCIVGLMMHGIGFGCIVVPCFTDGIKSAVNNGFPDDITTYGLISGLWASSFALGAFIGPSVAGFLYDMVGFREGSLFVIITQLFMCVAASVFIILDRRPSASKDQTYHDEEEDNTVLMMSSSTESCEPIRITTHHRKSITTGYGSFSATLPFIEGSRRSRYNSLPGV